MCLRSLMHIVQVSWNQCYQGKCIPLFHFPSAFHSSVLVWISEFKRRLFVHDCSHIAYSTLSLCLWAAARNGTCPCTMCKHNMHSLRLLRPRRWRDKTNNATNKCIVKRAEGVWSRDIPGAWVKVIFLWGNRQSIFLNDQNNKKQYRTIRNSAEQYTS